MSSFIFWQRFLFYSSILLALAGVCFTLFGDNPLFEPYNHALAELFWQRQTIPLKADSFRAFTLGPLGGTMTCAYILLAFIAWYPFQQKERWARNAIIISFGTWFILDSAVSLYYGMYFQVYIINLISLLQKALPIAFTWKEFKKVKG